jgi:arylsulfatase A
MLLTHAPYLPTPDSADWDPKAFGEDTNKGVKHFADDVAYMDKLVGKLVQKVDDLGLRDNTLILFLGDNGTGKGVMSKWKGQQYPGGKGDTNARGMHVPLIASWPGHTPAGKVNDDIIDSTDFLPTICEAIGVAVPDSLDGRTFYPQILGEKGQPREWVYDWYSAQGVPPIREFAATKEYKLYRSGKFFDLKQDPFEEGSPKQVHELTGSEAAAAKKLQAVLAAYANARPAELQKTSDEIEKKEAPQRANRNKRRQKKNAAAAG